MFGLVLAHAQAVVCPDTARAAIAGCGPQLFERPLVVIAAVGDVLLDERLLIQGMTAPDGFGGIWRDLTGLLASADVAFANLEGPAAADIDKKGKPAAEPVSRFDDWVYSAYPMFNYPPAVPRALHEAGFTVLSTANNHALDRRKVGVTLTLDSIGRAGLAASGTRRPASPWAVLTDVDMGDTRYRIAWLACTYDVNVRGAGLDDVLLCYRNRPTILNEIWKLRSSGEVSAIIVTPHWGHENKLEVGAEQRQLAQDMVDAGATAIIGSHPHVLQEWEWITATDGRRSPVFYSLGNFVNDQQETIQRQSVVLLLSLARSPAGGLQAVLIGQVPIGMTEVGGYLRVEPLVHEHVLANVTMQNPDTGFAQGHRGTMAVRKSSPTVMDFRNLFAGPEEMLFCEPDDPVITPSASNAPAPVAVVRPNHAWSSINRRGEGSFQEADLLPPHCTVGDSAVRGNFDDAPSTEAGMIKPPLASAYALPVWLPYNLDPAPLTFGRQATFPAGAPPWHSRPVASRAFVADLARRLIGKVTIAGSAAELPATNLFAGTFLQFRGDARSTLAAVLDSVFSQVGRDDPDDWFLSVEVGGSNHRPRGNRSSVQPTLSNSRAQALARVLVSEGLPPDRIRTPGPADNLFDGTNDSTEGTPPDGRIRLILAKPQSRDRPAMCYQ